MQDCPGDVAIVQNYAKILSQRTPVLQSVGPESVIKLFSSQNLENTEW
jgi:hypothetical protein